MKTLLSFAAFALLLAVVAPAAMAAPASRLAPQPVALHPGHVSVGFGVGVGVPVAPPTREIVVVRRPRGHYETRIERIWVPGQHLGYDVYGYPVYSRGYWTERHIRVWVPHRGRHRHARRVVRTVTPAPVTHVGFGVQVVR